MSEAGVTEAGVDALIERLHRDGVAAGRDEAARIIATARAEADALVAAARADRDRILAEAERERETLRRSSAAALDLALRDTLLRAREALTMLLADRLGARVGTALEDPALLAELIVGAARQMTDLGTLHVEIDGALSDRLAALADRLCADLADDQPVLHPVAGQPGVVLRRDGANIAIELSDATLTGFLFAQLRPRFRKIFEGARLG